MEANSPEDVASNSAVLNASFVSAAVKFRVVGLLQTEQPRRPDSRTGHKPLSAECFVWAESAGH